jgi:hypothetical protein
MYKGEMLTLDCSFNCLDHIFIQITFQLDMDCQVKFKIEVVAWILLLSWKIKSCVIFFQTSFKW